jgi:HAD superfamily hydrolase (TIGR01509 family)
MTPEVLLFDLGGVLMEFTGLRDIGPLLRERLTSVEIEQRWEACPHLLALERGEYDRVTFATRFMAAWGVQIESDRFLQEFASWSRLLPGAEILLAELRPRYRLAALSNANEICWERQTDVIGITGWFEVAMASYQLGVQKPDRAIYEAALERLNVPANAVVFLDDGGPTCKPQETSACARFV